MKYKVGDEVRIKGTDIGGTVESIIREQLIVNSKGSKIPVWPEDIVLMKSVEEETVLNTWTGLKVELELSKSVIGVSNVESIRGERFMSGFVKAIIPPEGYIFKDENGNVIKATKIVLEKKKKEYPKTYEECCEIMNVIMETEIVADAYSERLDDYELNLDTKIENLRKLLICRDTYWKIAGEEMGLGKPWEPNWEGEGWYVIVNHRGDIVTDIQWHANAILAFPTAEMRDAFKENFDPDIEICKELL